MMSETDGGFLKPDFDPPETCKVSSPYLCSTRGLLENFGFPLESLKFLKHLCDFSEYT